MKNERCILLWNWKVGCHLQRGEADEKHVFVRNLKDSKANSCWFKKISANKTEREKERATFVITKITSTI